MTTTTDQPTVCCPCWCSRPLAQHVGELEDRQGRVVHSGRRIVSLAGGRRLEVTIGSRTLPDGALDPEHPQVVIDYEAGTGLSPDELMTVVECLLEVIRETHASTVRVR